MTDAERLILENQKTILHGLRALLLISEAPINASDMQDAMMRTHDALNADAIARAKFAKETEGYSI